MKKIYNIAKSFKEAEDWDIHQYLNMSPEERIKIAQKLIKIYYGTKNLDIRESRYFKCRKLNFQKT